MYHSYLQCVVITPPFRLYGLTSFMENRLDQDHEVEPSGLNYQPFQWDSHKSDKAIVQLACTVVQASPRTNGFIV